MRRVPASLLLCAVLLRADFEPPRWPFRKPLDVPAPGLCSVQVNREIFASSCPGLPDVRVVAAGAEVPWVLDRTARETVAHVVPARSEDASDRATVLTVDLGAANLPHDRMRLEIRDSYFYRKTLIDAGDDGREWVPLLSRALYRLPAGEELEIAFPERRDRFLRLRILNGDDRPLAVGKVYVEGLGTRVRFLARNAGRHWLYYGNAAARRPVYDLARILDQQPPSPGVVLRAGPQEPNPDYLPDGPPPKPWTERHSGLLYLTLAGAVAGLGYILLRFRRHLT